VASSRRGTLMLLISSTDPHCGPCVQVNADFTNRARADETGARYVQLSWQPWQRFPPEATHLLGQHGIRNAVPVQFMFKDGQLVDKQVGMPRRADQRRSGTVEQIDPGWAAKSLPKSRGVVMLMLSSFETDCAFCMRANPVWESFAIAARGAAVKSRVMRLMYSPWRSIRTDPFARQHEVGGLPVFMTFKDGRLLHRVDGIRDADELRRLLFEGLD
jgi:hypothetical protein